MDCETQVYAEKSKLSIQLFDGLTVSGCCALPVLEVSFQSLFHSTTLNYWIKMDVYSLFILKAQFNT